MIDRFLSSVAVADFNGDGRADIAVASKITRDLSVLLNLTAVGATTPSFAAPQTFAIGMSVRSVAVGDFNADGRPDLAVTNYGGESANTVTVLLNATAVGAATPAFIIQPAFAVGSDPTSVVVADFNADGRPDLAVTNSLSGSVFTDVSVLLNVTAAGATSTSFVAQQTLIAGARPYSAAVGDFDGDGRADIAFANITSNTVSVLRNTTAMGSSTLTFAEIPQTFDVGSNPYSVSVGDFDGDGRPDLVTTNYSAATVSVLLNVTAAGVATPTFAAQRTFAVGSLGGTFDPVLSPISVSVGDFNGDGRPDLAVANGESDDAMSNGVVSVLLNTSTGTLTTAPALTGQFGNTGVWGYNRTTNIWANLDTRNATALATAPNGNVVANFAGAGVYYYRASTGGWTNINGQPASALAMDQYGNAVINFPSFGTYEYSLSAGYVNLVGTSAAADQLAVSANGDVIANFPGFGVYRYRAVDGWQQLNGYNATSLAVDPNGYVVSSFAGFGVGQYIPYANGWRLLTPAGATSVALDGYGNVFAAFAGYGIGRWSVATGSWTNLGPGAAATSLAADWFGNVFAAVPGFGVSEFSQAFGWTRRRANDATVLGLGR